MLFQILRVKRDFNNILYIASFQIRTKKGTILYISYWSVVCLCVWYCCMFGHSCHSSYVPILVRVVVVGRNRSCRWKEGLFMCRIASLFLLQRLKGSMSGDARDFNIETRAVIKSSPPPVRQGTEGNSRRSDRNMRGTSAIVCHRQKLGYPVLTWWFFHSWCVSS